MFDKLKKGVQNAGELKDAYSKAREMQKKMAEISSTGEYNDWKVVVTGDDKVDSVTQNGEEQRDVRKAMNDALKQLKDKKNEVAMSSLKENGFGPDKLGELGKMFK